MKANTLPNTIESFFNGVQTTIGTQLHIESEGYNWIPLVDRYIETTSVSQNV